MANTLEIIAAAVERKPHSFQFIRKATGLTMSDEELTALAQSDQNRFKLVRFLKRDAGGADPSRPPRRGAAESLTRLARLKQERSSGLTGFTRSTRTVDMKSPRVRGSRRFEIETCWNRVSCPTPPLRSRRRSLIPRRLTRLPPIIPAR